LRSGTITFLTSLSFKGYFAKKRLKVAPVLTPFPVPERAPAAFRPVSSSLPTR
jgi:hypothetical protein